MCHAVACRESERQRLPVVLSAAVPAGSLDFRVEDAALRNTV